MNKIISILPLITLGHLIFIPSIHAAASTPGATLWKTAPVSYSDATAHTHPLIQISTDLFAVGQHNQLIATSCKTGEPAETPSLATHPDYFTNGTPDDVPEIAQTHSLEHPHYMTVQIKSIKKNISQEDLISNTEIKRAPTKHQSPVLGCARHENIVASVSPWHIMLTHLDSQDTPEIIAHTAPLLIPLNRTKILEAPLGRFGSDNWMRCIAINNTMIATGQFDGSIFLWNRPHDGQKKPQVARPRINTFTESRTVKQLQFSSDGQTLYAVNRHGLTKLILSELPEKLIRGFRAKPAESATFESMFLDEAQQTIYVGTASGSVYRYQLSQGNIELLTDLSGFSSPDKKINVIKKIGTTLYLGTGGGNLYTYDANRHPSMQKIVGNDSSAICNLLPIDDKEMIISRQNGALQKIMLTEK